MPQRIRGAIDRTIAEEQARQNGSGDGGSLSRSGSTGSRPAGAGRKPRDKPDATDASPNPDPAVFEEAFVIDDSDEPSRTGTPKPPVPEKDAPSQNEAAATNDGDGPDAQHAGKDGSADNANEKSAGSTVGEKSSSQSQAVPPEIRQKLRKLEKLEATYPGA